MKINIAKPWVDQTIKLVVPGTGGPKPVPSRTESVNARWAVYSSNSRLKMVSVIVIPDPHVKKICVAQGECDFYLSDPAGMAAFFLSGGQLLWRKSFVEIPIEGNNIATAIARLEKDFDGEKLRLQMDDMQRVTLKTASGVDPFFVRSSQPRTPQIAAIDVTDGI